MAASIHRAWRDAKVTVQVSLQKKRWSHSSTALETLCVRHMDHPQRRTQRTKHIRQNYPPNAKRDLKPAGTRHHPGPTYLLSQSITPTRRPKPGLPLTTAPCSRTDARWQPANAVEAQLGAVATIMATERHPQAQRYLEYSCLNLSHRQSQPKIQVQPWLLLWNASSRKYIHRRQQYPFLSE